MRHAFACVLLVGVTGCAANVVRLEHAGAVSTQATATVKAANAYVAGVQERRRAANIALVASDPSCGWGDVVTTDTEWMPPRGFCDVRGVPRERRVSISLRPISDEAIGGVTMAVAGIATYQQALADVLDQQPVDAKAGLTDAIDKLSTAATDINRIASSQLVNLGPMTGGSARAVADLVGTLVALQQTDLKVRRVHAVVARVPVEPLFADLLTGATALTTLQDANSTTRERFALEAGYAREVNHLTFSQRREWVGQIAAAADEDASLRKARLGTLKQAIDGLATADRALRAALAGDFSPAERRRIARENRTAILGILSKVAAIFPAP